MINNLKKFSPPEQNSNAIEFLKYSFEQQMPLLSLSILFLFLVVLLLVLFLKNRKGRIVIGLFILLCVIISFIPVIPLFKSYTNYIDTVQLQQTEKYKQVWLQEEVLPKLKEQEKIEYGVLNTSFVSSHINQNGLHWIPIDNQSELCMNGVVLELIDDGGNSFFATGLIQMISSEGDEYKLVAHSIEEEIDGIVNAGLYQGILTVPNSIYEQVGCN